MKTISVLHAGLILGLLSVTGCTQSGTGISQFNAGDTDKIIGAWQLEILGNEGEEKTDIDSTLVFFNNGSWKATSFPYGSGEDSGIWSFGQAAPGGFVIHGTNVTNLKEKQRWAMILLPNDRLRISGGFFHDGTIWKRKN